ncbi:MAG: hypothetical protein QM220_09155 [Atribacterota bacterium]|nr:hypothetical protein [Atribacterota bacterium]
MEEESFRDMRLSFHNGRKIPYLFEITSYYGNEPEETNIIKDETDLFVKIFQKINGNSALLLKVK